MGKKKVRAAKSKEIIQIKATDKLIIRAPKNASPQNIQDLITNMDKLRTGATNTLIIPYQYKVYEIIMEE